MKTIRSILLLLPAVVLGQGFYSFPNPNVGTLTATNVNAIAYTLNSNSILTSAAADEIQMLDSNGAPLSFLIWGTNTSSSVGIRQNGGALYVRKGDHSDWGTLHTGTLRLNGIVQPTTNNAVDIGSSTLGIRDLWSAGDVYVGAGGSFRFGTSRTRIDSTANGVLSFRTATAGNMTRVLFGTGDSSGAALSFAGTQIQSTDGVGTLSGFAAGTVDIGHASDTTLARSAAGIVTIEGARVATSATPDTLTYSGTDVTVTAGKGPLQRSLLTCTNDFTLKFDSLTATDGGTIYVAPAATNCTVTLPAYVFGLGARTLTITGGTGNTNYTKIAWENDVIGGTNRVSVNAGNYY